MGSIYIDWFASPNSQAWQEAKSENNLEKPMLTVFDSMYLSKKGAKIGLLIGATIFIAGIIGLSILIPMATPATFGVYSVIIPYVASIGIGLNAFGLILCIIPYARIKRIESYLKNNDDVYYGNLKWRIFALSFNRSSLDS